MRALVFALTALATPAVAGADIIISNLAEANVSSTLFGTGASTQYKAFGFTMGTADYTLDEVVLALTSTSAAPNPEVAIWSDAGGSPGALLLTLDNPPVVTGTDDFVFTPSAPFTLASGTSYWVYVTSVPVGGDPFNWSSAAPLPTGPGATAIGYEFNGGSSSFFNKLEVRGSSGIGTNYCTANANSTGVAGVISATGSNVASANSVTLTASNIPVGTFGIFVTSVTQDFVPNVGSGNLCVGGAIGRYQQPGQIQQANAAGEFSLAIDTTAVPQGTVVVPIAVGETRNFQAWFRDFTTTPPISLTSNLTDAISITFQ